MERKLVLRNMVTSFILQVVTIVSGFVVPKIILNYFGSDVNGLVSSITQFLSYIQLIEGGLGSVILAALYKPLSDGDNQRISGIVNATDSFFKKIGFIYIIYMILLGVVYPIVVDAPYSNIYIFGLVIVLGMNLFAQYFFSITYRLLLNADRKVYVISLTQTAIVTVNMILVVVCAKVFNDILIIKAASAIVFFIAPVVFNIYVSKHYYLDKTVEKDRGALKQRWDGFGINLAYFIHSNTDIVILTFLSTLANVSVYSIYLMIVKAIRNLVMSVSNAITPSFGKALAGGDQKEINWKFDLYEFGMTFVTVISFVCGMVLITPFVSVYTNNITDANYHQPLFGVMLVISEMVYCLRDPYVSAAYSAGRFKQISKYAYGEAILNIVVSLALVKQLGILGVAIGTVVGMTFRMVTQALYLQKHILYRRISKFLKMLLFATIISTATLIAFNQTTAAIYSSYILWIFKAICVFVFTSIFTALLSSIFYKKEFDNIIGNRIKSLIHK